MKRYMIIIGTMLFFSLNASWVERFLFTSHEKHQVNQSLIFESSTNNRFTQLLFAWNAQRPATGHFSFYVQVRHADTKQWGKWHHAADWGNGIQCSYESSSDGISKHCYVRHEMESPVHADAFRVKVIATMPDDLYRCKYVMVTTAAYHHFQSEDASLLHVLPSVYIDKVPMFSQMKMLHPEYERLCSPTSCMMVGQYLFSLKDYAVKFPQASYDSGLDTYGSWPFNMAYLFEHSGSSSYLFFHTRLHSFVEVHKQLCRKIPVMVSVRGTLTGAPRPYPHGHLLVVVGFDAHQHQVICHDPAQPDDSLVCTRYHLVDFLRAWEASRRLVYWIEPVIKTRRYS